MDMTHIQYFCALHEHRSFQKAADSIPITIQGLRKSIRAVENELGVSLFLRGKDTLVFSEAGERFFDFCKTVQDQYRLLLMDVDAARRGTRTRVSMAFSMGAFGLFSPQFAEVLFDDLQNQKLTHITRPEHEIVKGLKEGHYDFAVTWGNPDEALFAHEPLGRVPFLVIMNRKHPLASRSHVLLEELRDEKFIFFDAKTRPLQLLEQACRARGFAPDTSCATNETMVMLTYLSRNLGIGAALPNEIALYDRTQFCTVRVEDVCFPLGISYLREHLFTDGERAFLKTLKRIYAMNEKGC